MSITLSNYPILTELSQERQELTFAQIIHPYIIVVTQDCDLDWDYKTREKIEDKPSKLLNSVILCEIGTARDIKGTANMNSGQWKLVREHRDERFYFFEKIPIECDLGNEGLPELTADFKKVFGVDADTLYHQIKIGIVKRRTVLVIPYLEHFSKRYHNFHSRVALPSQYESQREG